MKKLVILLMIVLLLGGCSLKDNRIAMVEKEIQIGLNEKISKDKAHEIMSLAREEFFEGVPSSEESLLTQTSGEVKLGVREYIIGYAWEGYITGDPTKLYDYLKEQGLYERYLQIVKKYDLEKYQKILDVKSNTVSLLSVSESFFDNYLTGDIFLCYGGNSSSSGKLLGFFIPGIWKHAGIMDAEAPDRNAPILSASDQTTSGFCVGYETKTKWAGEASVAAYRVYGRTDQNARSGVDYAKQFIGMPYDVFASRTSDDSWYCSKVVYRAWLSQGINIEPTPWLTDPWVTPTDLADDNDTYWIGGDQS